MLVDGLGELPVIRQRKQLTLRLVSPSATITMSKTFGIPDPETANLTELTQRQIVCYLTQGENEYNGRLGARISSIFVIGVISTAATLFPVIAKRSPRLHIPLYVYLFVRYFGSGVIVATAFIHLLEPAFDEIGPASCVGLTGGWAVYPWAPALVLTSVMGIFLMDFIAERYVEMKYGVSAVDSNVQAAVTGQSADQATNTLDPAGGQSGRTNGAVASGNHGLSAGVGANSGSERRESVLAAIGYEKKFYESPSDEDEQARRLAVQQQLAAFLILEFGIIFHSVIIGLNLGVAGDEFSTLYPVLVFHQSFEGLGIGARMSAIPFKKGSVIPWLLCLAYGLTTPIAIAAGLGVRTTYNSGSYTANVVSGVLDSLSAGILIYSGLVELLARDFLFNPLRTKDNKQLAFMMVCVFLGTGIMALLGKWA